MTKASLQASGIHVKIGAAHILCNLNILLHPGELCAVIGPSGAGKSTLIKVLLGLKQASSGNVALGNSSISSCGGVGYVPQDDALHRHLTVAEALQFSADLWLHDLPESHRKKRIDIVSKQMGLQERLTLSIKSLSGGQRKRVAVALELLHEPALLILDEPTSGLDPGLESQMMSLFQELARKDRILLVATHAMQSLTLCDVLAVMVSGRFAYTGSPQAALDWFNVSTFAGIFEKLPTKEPAEWANQWSNSAQAQQFATRHAPIKIAAINSNSKETMASPSLNSKDKLQQLKERYHKQ